MGVVYFPRAAQGIEKHEENDREEFMIIFSRISFVGALQNNLMYQYFAMIARIMRLQFL